MKSSVVKGLLSGFAGYFFYHRALIRLWGSNVILLALPSDDRGRINAVYDRNVCFTWIIEQFLDCQPRPA